MVKTIGRGSKKDQIKRKYLENEGLTYISIQECQFIKNIKPMCLHLYKTYLPHYYIANKGKLIPQQIVTDILKKVSLFGVAKVDITIEEGYEKYFEEYPPFFAPAMYQ